MLTILFAGGASESAGPELPDLYVADSLSGEDIPVAGVNGWDDDFLQTQTLSFAPMEFQAVNTSLSAGNSTSEYWTRRMSKAVINCLFSTSGANAVLLPIYHDKNGLLSYGSQITINAITETKNSDYCSTMEILETYGASKISFKVVSVSVGTVKVHLAGV